MTSFFLNSSSKNTLRIIKIWLFFHAQLSRNIFLSIWRGNKNYNIYFEKKNGQISFTKLNSKNIEFKL